jgi:hypothetical protein
MLRLARRLLAPCSAVSLALFAAAVTLWVTPTRDLVRREAPAPFVYLGTDRGALSVGLAKRELVIGERFGVSRGVNWPGLRFYTTAGMDRPNRRVEVRVALWPLVVSTAALPLAWLVRFARRRRQRPPAARAGFEVAAPGAR